MNNLLDIYYSEIIGEEITDKNIIKHNELVLDYLKESGLSDIEIFKLITNLKPSKDGKIEINNLPSTLWDNSLLEKDVFYYHKELKILPPPPNGKRKYIFYCEMKIKYTEKDVLKYFCNRFKINQEWIDENKEVGSIKFLLKEYNKFNFIKPVDFLLNLIDYVYSANDTVINSLFQLREYEMEVASYLSNDVKNAEHQEKNKIIWRTDVCVI